MKNLILVFILALCFDTKADDLLLGQKTFHLEKYMCAGCPELRESNPLIGYSTKNYAAFYMINSYDKDSVVLVRKFSWDYTGRIRPFIAAGVGTGYSDYAPQRSLGDFTALAYMGFDWHPDRDKWGYTITVVPRQFVSIGIRITIK
jgi:hypothetical protein